MGMCCQGGRGDRGVREEDTGPPPPPDGGWGWVVVAASFLFHLVLDAIRYSFFGILLWPVMDHYRDIMIFKVEG